MSGIKQFDERRHRIFAATNRRAGVGHRVQDLIAVADGIERRWWNATVGRRQQL